MEAVFVVIGEIYLCNLISLIGAQKACMEAGLKFQVQFNEYCPTFENICKAHQKENLAFLVICPGNAGFSETDAFRSFTEGKPFKKSVPHSLDLEAEEMVSSTFAFYSLDKATVDGVVQSGLSALENSEDAGSVRAIIDYTFQGAVGRRNFLKIR
jgi:hypothetical protein